MKTWTHQPGYPLVHVHRGKNGIIHISQVIKNTITLSQHYYRPIYLQRPFKGGDVPSIDNATMAISASWWVPISLTDSESRKFSLIDTLPVVWVSSRKPSVELVGPKFSSSWVLVNLKLNSYYCVNYDRTNQDQLRAIVARLHLFPVHNTSATHRRRFHFGPRQSNHLRCRPFADSLPVQHQRRHSGPKKVKNHIEYIETLHRREFD